MRAGYRIVARAVALALLVVALEGAPPRPGAAAETEAAYNAAESKVFAVRLPAGQEQLAAAVRQGGFVRWVLPRQSGWELAVGPDAEGAVEVRAALLPLPAAWRAGLAGLPVALDGATLQLDGRRYDDPRQVLAVRLPRAARPTWVVAGYRAERVASLVDQVLLRLAGVEWRSRGLEEADYLLSESPYLWRRGRWRPVEGGWAVDPAADDDGLARRAATYAALVRLERPHLRLAVPPERAEDPAWTRLASQLAEAAGDFATRLDLKEEQPVTVLVEEDFVAQGRHVGQIGPAVEGPDGDLHLVYHPDDLEAYRFALARLLVGRAGLAADRPWLADGAALWLSGGWYGRSWRDWPADLAAVRVLPTAAELLATERQDDASEVLWPPLAAAVIAGLPGDDLAHKLARLPAEATVERLLAELAAGSVTAAAAPVEPESGSHPRRGAALDNPAVGRGQPASEAPATLEAQPPGPPPRRRSSASRTPPPFLRGVSLAMVPGLESGYHAPAVERQLDRLAALGADAVSLMPFATQPGPTEPQLRLLNDGPGQETDVGLLHAARAAHARGMTVLWKPHLWVGHGSWPGEIEMTSEADWRAWWRAYRRYVLHHAVLAEHSGAEMLCLGVELGRTLEHREEWEALIRAARRLYSGRLTYAGNWWGDYDRFPLWDRLDAVGVDAYFPLAHEAEATPQELAAGARRIAAELAAAARRFGKPVLLTEVGFAAQQGAWVEPHSEGGALSEEDQLRAYRALLGSLGRPPWLGGLFVWKAFSDPDAGRRDRPDFHFLGRPAEAAVHDYFNPEPTPTTVR